MKSPVIVGLCLGLLSISMARQLKDSLTRTVNCPVTSEASEMSKRLPESVFKQEEGRGPGHTGVFRHTGMQSGKAAAHSG